MGNAAAFGNVAMDPTKIFGPTELGYTPTDEKHRALISGVVQTKFGIQVAPIVQIASGRPLNITEGITDVQGFGAGNAAWRAIVKKDSLTDYTATKAFNAAQLRTGLSDGSLVTLPYNALRVKGFFQWDMRVSKAFKIHERNKIDVMANFYDLTNHVNHGIAYATSIRAANFLQPTNFFSTSGVVVPHQFSAEFGFRYSF